MKKILQLNKIINCISIMTKMKAENDGLLQQDGYNDILDYFDLKREIIYLIVTNGDMDINKLQKLKDEYVRRIKSLNCPNIEEKMLCSNKILLVYLPEYNPRYIQGLNDVLELNNSKWQKQFDAKQEVHQKEFDAKLTGKLEEQKKEYQKELEAQKKEYQKEFDANLMGKLEEQKKDFDAKLLAMMIEMRSINNN